MKAQPILLVTLAVLLVGATTPTSCNIPWASLLSSATSTTLGVHVVNKAYLPVSFSLTTSTTTTAAAASTQPSGGGTSLDAGAQYDTTILCTSLPEVLAVKATMTEKDGTSVSAASETLHVDSDYKCGSDVTFTVREAARVGIVVGAEVN